MMPLLQTFGLEELSSFIGVAIVQAMGGSLFLLGLTILIVIAVICWKLNVHITAGFFLSFIAMSFLKLYFNDPGFGDIGIFGTLYNIMLFGMAVMFVMFLNDLRK